LYVPTTAANSEVAVITDQQWWAEHFEEGTQRYTDWIAG
jgi:hypothetical protein